MSELTIGVAVPTLNSAVTLRAALESLRGQEGCIADIIVADSGSSDGTLEICADLDVRALYVPPGSMYQAINEGLRELQTEWVAYLNSDDLIYADSYRRLLSRGVETDADVVYGDGDVVDVAGRFLYSARAPAPQALPSLFRALFFGFMPHAAIFRRSVFQDLGGFDQTFRHVADMDFFARACFAGKAFAAVPKPPVAAFRVHSAQLTSREPHVANEERGRLAARWGRGGAIAKRWAIARWKVQNLGQYVLRWLRTGSFKRAV